MPITFQTKYSLRPEISDPRYVLLAVEGVMNDGDICMSYIEVRFNSRDEKYKYPAGPIVSGTVLRLRAEIVCDDVERAQVVFKYDRHDVPAYYDMERGEDGVYEVEFPVEDRGLYWYHFEVETARGMYIIGKSGLDNRAEVMNAPKAWQQTVYHEDYKEPAWIYGGAYYHIFVDRFNHAGEYIEMPDKITRKDWGGLPLWRPIDGEVRNNDFFGGNLEGIREKLPYLKELGVTCLYLSPIFEAYSNHKYDTSDYMNIDPMFGDKAGFEKLCRDAEEMGISIVLDGVFAHTGSDSVYFNKKKHYGAGGAWNDRNSPYREWYTFNEDGTYESWWGIDTLPKITKKVPESYTEFICGENGVVRTWLRAGARGWRLDVVDELPSSFLKNLVEAAKAEKADALIIGEVWEDASNKMAYEERKNYFEGDKLDTVMNYPFKNALIYYIRTGNSGYLAETVEEILENYPSFAVNALMNNVGTHDSIRVINALVGKEINPCLETREEQSVTMLTEEAWERGIRLLKLCSMIQITLPGVPCIYYGDEAGVEGYADPFNRRCYPWGHENMELRDWYHRMLKIRKEHQVYRKGSYRTVASGSRLYAFERYGEGESIITAVNLESSVVSIAIPGKYRDLITGEVFDNIVNVEPESGMILERIPD